MLLLLLSATPLASSDSAPDMGMLFAATPKEAYAVNDTCSNGISCIRIPVNGFLFDCRLAGPALHYKSSVLLLHGFPEWSEMFVPLMRRLANASHRSLACNQRGYSPGARPDRKSAYTYNELASDAFAVHHHATHCVSLHH